MANDLSVWSPPIPFDYLCIYAKVAADKADGLRKKSGRRRRPSIDEQMTAARKAAAEAEQRDGIPRSVGMGKDGPFFVKLMHYTADAIARREEAGHRLDAARWAANEKLYLETHRRGQRLTQDDKDLAYWWAVGEGDKHSDPVRAKWEQKWERWVNLMTFAFHPATDKAEAFNAATRARALFKDPELNWKQIRGPFHDTVKQVVPRPMLRRLAIQLGRELGDIPRKLHGVPLRDVGRRHRRPHGVLDD